MLRDRAAADAYALFLEEVAAQAPGCKSCPLCRRAFGDAAAAAAFERELAGEVAEVAAPKER